MNLYHPDDFKGHSLSVSDVVVLHEKGKDTAYYVDSIGFRELPNFLEDRKSQKIDRNISMREQIQQAKNRLLRPSRKTQIKNTVHRKGVEENADGSKEPYTLMVQPDDILVSPREVDDHFGTMVCFHPRYALGDSHNYVDKDDFLREMYLDTVGNDEAGMKRYERMVNIVSSRFRHGPKPEERAVDDAMQKVISEKYLMLPLYLYDHSGLAMSTETFVGKAVHAEWDSGQVGWIYVSKEDALKEFDSDHMTGAIRKKPKILCAVKLQFMTPIFAASAMAMNCIRMANCLIAAGGLSELWTR